MAAGSALVTPTAYCSWCLYRRRGCGVGRSKGVKGLISLVQLQLVQQVTDAHRSALPLLAILQVLWGPHPLAIPLSSLQLSTSDPSQLHPIICSMQLFLGAPPLLPGISHQPRLTGSSSQPPSRPPLGS